MSRKLIYIFGLAFLLNWVWENLHSNLYVHHQGGQIVECCSQWFLLQATFLDAFFITAMGLLFIKVAYLNKKQWLVFVFGFTAAITTEVYALQAGHWAYTNLMPIIPIINTGLSPTIQLGIIAFAVYKLVGVGKK